MTTLRELHQGPDILLLANAWDAGSARLIESLGAKAIATTSAGLAWSCGYPDGDALPIDRLIQATRDIARAVRVPLTIDIEGGYSDDPAFVATVVAGVIAAGAVGINIEDGSAAPELLCAKIEAARTSAAQAGVDLFINARTDVYLRRLATGQAAIDEVARRAERYAAAGCDGVFVPGLVQHDEISAVVAAIGSIPLNVMLRPTLPSLDILRDLGVRRLSAGGAIAEAVLATTERLAREFLAGAWTNMFESAVDYGDMNRLFARD